jgi:hypothetical protein
MKRTFLFLLVTMALASVALASPKKKVIEGKLDDVFNASVRAAQKHWSVTFVDHQLHIFSFNTGNSFASPGMECSASVETA